MSHAGDTLLPSLVDRRPLGEGHGEREATRSIAQRGGPGIAGAVVQLLTAPRAILWVLGAPARGLQAIPDDAP
jgi:hypothetical protein